MGGLSQHDHHSKSKGDPYNFLVSPIFLGVSTHNPHIRTWSPSVCRGLFLRKLDGTKKIARTEKMAKLESVEALFPENRAMSLSEDYAQLFLSISSSFIGP